MTWRLGSLGLAGFLALAGIAGSPGSLGAAPGFFLRGDANLDERVDVSDAIWILDSLFVTGKPPSCLDAADCDDSGKIDISDAIATLGYLFLGRPELPAPFPEKGPDPTDDDLSCGFYPSAPHLDPPRPLEASEVDDDLDAVAFQSIGVGDGGIVVDDEIFDLLKALPPGASLLDHVGDPRVQAFMEDFFAEPAGAECPVAIPDLLTAPLGPDGCYHIEATMLRGKSHDSGWNAGRASDLQCSVEPDVVCGVGEHLVRFTVTDPDGLTSSATTVVTLCQGNELDCKEALSSLEEPPSSSSSHEEFRCHWVTAAKQVPTTENNEYRGEHFDEKGNPSWFDWRVPGGIGTDATVISKSVNGEGPVHDLFVARLFPRCTTPQSNLALLGYGYLILRMNVICLNHDAKVPMSISCGGRVDLEGSYAGGVKVFTDSGAKCGSQINPIEALAQEEARLDANGETIFNKALSVQNGNKIQKKITYEVSTGVGVNSGGASGDLKITFGHSQEVEEATGRRIAQLNAFGSKRFQIPLTASLEASGKAELVAAGNANGKAQAATQAISLYALGYSNCPGADFIAVLFVDGRGDAFDLAMANAKDFFYEHTGMKDFLKKLIELGRQ